MRVATPTPKTLVRVATAVSHIAQNRLCMYVDTANAPWQATTQRHFRDIHYRTFSML